MKLAAFAVPSSLMLVTAMWNHFANGLDQDTSEHAPQLDPPAQMILGSSAADQPHSLERILDSTSLISQVHYERRGFADYLEEGGAPSVPLEHGQHGKLVRAVENVHNICQVANRESANLRHAEIVVRKNAYNNFRSQMVKNTLEWCEAHPNYCNILNGFSLLYLGDCFCDNLDQDTKTAVCEPERSFDRNNMFARGYIILPK